MMVLGVMALIIWMLNVANLPTDLEVYRRGAQVVVDGHDAVYDTPYGLLPFTYPPIAALMFAPLAVLPGALALAVMISASLAGLVVLVAVTLRRLGHRGVRLMTGVLLLSFLLEPVTETLGFGQVNLVLVALVLWDLTHPRSRWSGVLLAIAISVKLTPAVFLALPLLRRDWPFLKRSLGIVAVGVVAPVLVMPNSWHEFWFHAVSDPTRVGGVAYSGNQSVNGLVWRLVGQGGAPALTALICVAIVAVGLLGVWRDRLADPLASIVMLSLCGLLISPISWSHHWVWAVPTMLVLGDGAWRGWARGERGRTTRVVAALFGLWLLATVSRVIWWGPAGHGTEYSADLFVTVATSAYTVLGVATLVTLAVLAGRGSAIVPGRARRVRKHGHTGGTAKVQGGTAKVEPALTR